MSRVAYLNDSSKYVTLTVLGAHHKTRLLNVQTLREPDTEGVPRFWPKPFRHNPPNAPLLPTVQFEDHGEGRHNVIAHTTKSPAPLT